MNGINRFNIRVYGIVINNENQVLLCTEERNGFRFTKFPGGGLEFGEGIIDCLKREFREETGSDIKNYSHYFTTEEFQQSAFIQTDQIISIYYKAELAGEPLPEGRIIDGLEFNWKKISELKDEDLTFPIDKFVAEKLKSEL
jgi:8-oxo-dGTP diphosphatase